MVKTLDNTRILTLVVLMAVLFPPLLLAKHHDEHDDSSSSPQVKRDRKGKLFPIFSIVTFKNDACQSNSVLAGSNHRNGTCLPSSECSSRRGTASGNCAAGFGVCCLFTVTDSGTVSQNCTYLRNPGFPSTYSDTSSITYRINKCDPTVCTLCLSFESFTILGPVDSLELDGGECSLDALTTSTQTGERIPIICGQNTGQHYYVDFGCENGDSVDLAFTFTGTSSVRQWEIKATQLKCGEGPPQGCFQYFTTATGWFTSFNFLPTTGSSNLANHQYAICIEPCEGFCCIEYAPCDEQDAFSIRGHGGVARVDDACRKDYVRIDRGSAVCDCGANGPVTTRFCGPFFNAIDMATVDATVCQCGHPFKYEIYTDAVGDIDTGNEAYSRGVCVQYKQIPCSC